MTMMTSGAAPCQNPECRTTGGSARYGRPIRIRGLCFRCYFNCWRFDEWPAYVNPSTSLGRDARPWLDINNTNSIAEHLWTDATGKRQSHAVYGHHFDANAEIAEARQDAALWLMEHPMADLLEWPDPSLALFGAANAKAEAA